MWCVYAVCMLCTSRCTVRSLLSTLARTYLCINFTCSLFTPHCTDGVDITNPSTLTADLFKGVTQVVCSVGPVYGRTPEGGFEYINGMSPERVDAEVWCVGGWEGGEGWMCVETQR